MKNNPPARLVRMRDIGEIHKASKQEKIDILESVSQTAESSAVKKIISLLDDRDMEVRGEAFSALVINRSDISKILIEGLSHREENIRAFVSLILGNRKAQDAVEPLKMLTKDSSSSVRSCALGALGYLRADGAGEEIRNCFTDDSMEVKKSALKAAIDIDYGITGQELENFSKENDDELKKLAVIASQKNGGPEGI